LQRSFDHGAAVVVQPQGNGLGGYQGTRMRRTVEASALTGFEVRHMFDRGAESSYPAVTGPMGWLVFGQAGGMLPTTVVRETITEETHWAPGAGTIIQSSDARLEWTADANLRLVSSRNGDTMWETGAFGAASVAELVFAPAPAGDGLLRIRGTSGADLWVMESEGQTGHTLGIDGCTVGVANDSTMVWSQSGSDKDCLLAVMRINAMQAIPYTEPQVLLETPEAQLDWKADGDLVLYDRTDGSVLWSWGGFTPTELAAHQVELRYQDGSLVAGGSGGEVLRELEMPYWWTDRLPDHLVLSRCSFSAFSAWDSNNLRLPVWTVGGSACTDVVVSLNAAGDRMEVAGTQDADDITLELIWNQGVVWVDGMVLAIGSNSLTEVTHYVVDAGAGDDSVEVSCSDCGAVTVLGGAGTDTIHWAGWSSPAYYSSYFDTGTGVGDTIKVEMTNHALAQDFPSNVVVSAASATGAATIEVIHPADRDDETDWAFGTCYLSRYDPDAMAVNCGTTVPFGEGNNVAEAFELVEERGFGNSNFGAGYAIDVGIGIGQDGSTKRVGGTPLLIEAKLLGQTKNLIRAAAEVTESGGVVGAGAELVVADLTVWEAEVAVPVVTIAGGYTYDQEFWTYGKSIDLGLLSVTLTAEIVGSAGFEVAGEVSGGTVGLSVTPSLGLTVSADASASFACARAGISGELTLLSVAMPMSLEVDLSSGAYSADGLLELGSLSGSVRAYASACFVSASKTLVSFAGFFAEIPLFNVYGLAW
ncbi:MAG: hypothetical protein KC549_09765, partial [Myxococcales bacterium]|nr:hypothetical protein [Myxococcales bacterium]